MKVLELFSGTGSVSKICEELGWECFSVDISDKLYPVNLKIDILNWDYTKLDFKPDIIWASPPCASFSQILHIHKHINIKERMEKFGLPLLYKTREIINYFKPKYYFIENPDGGRMKNFITDLPFYRVCYCMYGYDYKKPTRIWTNKKTSFTPKYCNHKGKHTTTISHQRRNTLIDENLKRYIPKVMSKKNIKLSQKYSIPPQLIRDLFNNI